LELLGPVERREGGSPRLVPADGGPALAVWSSAWYAGPVRNAIVAWKRQGRGELERELTRAAARTAEAAARVLAQITPAVAVVPIPSRALRNWGEGARRTRALALAAAEALAGAGLEATLEDCLARRATSREQAGLAAHQRMRGREDATRVRYAPKAPCLLVDDVLTTGATLLDAERSLAAAGATVLGAIVLAATPAQSQTLEGGLP
jgi:predicted amidophosphoribosyltransferase